MMMTFTQSGGVGSGGEIKTDVECRVANVRSVYRYTI
jgi:hypothetical protein